MNLRTSNYILYGVVSACVLTAGATFILTNKSVHKISNSRPIATLPASTPRADEKPPTAINIPRIHKNLPIKPAVVRGNNWDLFDDSVAWLSTSSVPGSGNVILYAHDWVTLWADLVLLKPGDAIEIQQGTVWKTYTVTESRAVDGHDIQSILSNDNRLTLYTCEGNFDQKRRVVYASPDVGNFTGPR